MGKIRVYCMSSDGSMVKALVYYFFTSHFNIPILSNCFDFKDFMLVLVY